MWGHRAKDPIASRRANPPALLAMMVAASVGLAAIAASPGSARTTTRQAQLKPHLTTGAPIALDAPDNGSAPLAVYDPVSGASFIAWSNVQGTTGGVDLCVLPAGASGCDGGGPVLLNVSAAQNPVITGDNTIGLGGLTVLPNGDVVVIGTPVSDSSVAWESPADGSAFLTATQGLQNAGRFISPVSLFYAFNNAVAIDNTDVALLDDYGDKFSDSAYAGPESPALPNPNSNQGNNGMYPRKSLETSGPEVAAEAAPAPAAAGTYLVVGVGDNFSGPNITPAGCVNRYSTGYAVSVGQANPSSNAAGTLNHAGMPGYGLLACAAESPVLAGGGGAGIGVLEEEGNGISGAGSTWTVDYRQFIPTATGGSFGAPAELQDISGVSLDGGGDFDASEDSGKGVYASWVDEQGLVLDYSGNSGATWAGPNPQKELSNGATQSDPVIAGVGNGIGLVAYDANLGTGTQVFAQVVDFNPPTPTALTTAQTAGITTGADISVDAGTVGETDQATITGTNAASATGTVTYGLYSSSSCSTSSLVSSGGSEAVTSGKAAASAAVTKSLPPGTYYWQADYSGDVTNQPSKSVCGSETLTVAPVSVVGSATTTSSTLTFTISCSAACTVTVTVELPAAGSARASEKSRRAVKLTTGRFKLRKRGKDKLHLQWNKYARSLVKKDHDKLTTCLLRTTKVSKHTFKTASELKVRK